MIKPRGMEWVGHIIRIGEKRNAYKVLMGKPKRKGLYIGGRIILK
jgi:hypothetical protein